MDYRMRKETFQVRGLGDQVYEELVQGSCWNIRLNKEAVWCWSITKGIVEEERYKNLTNSLLFLNLQLYHSEDLGMKIHQSSYHR